MVTPSAYPLYTQQVSISSNPTPPTSRRSGGYDYTVGGVPLPPIPAGPASPSLNRNSEAPQPHPIPELGITSLSNWTRWLENQFPNEKDWIDTKLQNTYTFLRARVTGDLGKYNYSEVGPGTRPSEEIIRSINQNITTYRKEKAQIFLDIIRGLKFPLGDETVVLNYWTYVKNYQQMEEDLKTFYIDFIGPTLMKLAAAAEVAISLGSPVSQAVERIRVERLKELAKMPPSIHSVREKMQLDVLAKMVLVACDAAGTVSFTGPEKAILKSSRIYKHFLAEYHQELGIEAAVKRTRQNPQTPSLQGAVKREIQSAVTRNQVLVNSEPAKFSVGPKTFEQSLKEIRGIGLSPVATTINIARFSYTYLKHLEAGKPTSFNPERALPNTPFENTSYPVYSLLKEVDLTLGKAAGLAPNQIDLIERTWSGVNNNDQAIQIIQTYYQNHVQTLIERLTNAAIQAITNQTDLSQAIQKTESEIADELSRSSDHYDSIRSAICLSTVAKMIHLAAGSHEEIELSGLDQALIRSEPIFAPLHQRFSSILESSTKSDTPLLESSHLSEGFRRDLAEGRRMHCLKKEIIERASRTPVSVAPTATRMTPNMFCQYVGKPNAGPATRSFLIGAALQERTKDWQTRKQKALSNFQLHCQTLQIPEHNYEKWLSDRNKAIIDTASDESIEACKEGDKALFRLGKKQFPSAFWDHIAPLKPSDSLTLITQVDAALQSFALDFLWSTGSCQQTAMNSALTVLEERALSSLAQRFDDTELGKTQADYAVHKGKVFLAPLRELAKQKEISERSDLLIQTEPAFEPLRSSRPRPEGAWSLDQLKKRQGIYEENISGRRRVSDLDMWRNHLAKLQGVTADREIAFLYQFLSAIPKGETGVVQPPPIVNLPPSVDKYLLLLADEASHLRIHEYWQNATSFFAVLDDLATFRNQFFVPTLWNLAQIAEESLAKESSIEESIAAFSPELPESGINKARAELIFPILKKVVLFVSEATNSVSFSPEEQVIIAMDPTFRSFKVDFGQDLELDFEIEDDFMIENLIDTGCDEIPLYDEVVLRGQLTTASGIYAELVRKGAITLFHKNWTDTDQLLDSFELEPNGPHTRAMLLGIITHSPKAAQDAWCELCHSLDIKPDDYERRIASNFSWIAAAATEDHIALLEDADQDLFALYGDDESHRPRFTYETHQRIDIALHTMVTEVMGGAYLVFKGPDSELLTKDWEKHLDTIIEEAEEVLYDELQDTIQANYAQKKAKILLEPVFHFISKTFIKHKPAQFSDLHQNLIETEPALHFLSNKSYEDHATKPYYRLISGRLEEAETFATTLTHHLEYRKVVYKGQRLQQDSLNTQFETLSLESSPPMRERKSSSTSSLRVHGSTFGDWWNTLHGDLMFHRPGPDQQIAICYRFLFAKAKEKQHSGTTVQFGEEGQLAQGWEFSHRFMDSAKLTPEQRQIVQDYALTGVSSHQDLKDFQASFFVDALYAFTDSVELAMDRKWSLYRAVQVTANQLRPSLEDLSPINQVKAELFIPIIAKSVLIASKAPFTTNLFPFEHLIVASDPCFRTFREIASKQLSFDPIDWQASPLRVGPKKASLAKNIEAMLPANLSARGKAINTAHCYYLLIREMRVTRGEDFIAYQDHEKSTSYRDLQPILAATKASLPEYKQHVIDHLYLLAQAADLPEEHLAVIDKEVRKVADADSFIKAEGIFYDDWIIPLTDQLAEAAYKAESKPEEAIKLEEGVERIELEKERVSIGSMAASLMLPVIAKMLRVAVGERGITFSGYERALVEFNQVFYRFRLHHADELGLSKKTTFSMGALGPTPYDYFRDLPNLEPMNSPHAGVSRLRPAGSLNRLKAVIAEGSRTI